MAKKKPNAKRKSPPKSAGGAFPTAKKMGRYSGVVFEFYNDNTSVEQEGTVVIRGDAMVIEIPEQDGIAASLIVGRPCGTYFHGVNSVRDRDALKMDARWADLGDVFAGTWQDENDDLLFKFRLPK